MSARCGFVPPYLLVHLAETSPDVVGYAGGHGGYAATLAEDQRLRAARQRSAPGAPARAGAPPGAPAWTVHDAGGSTALPGAPVRSAGQPATGDPAVDEAADGVTGALALFAEVYGRDSYDGRGAPVSLTVHYGRGYANAFWDGTQLVFGDGDGRVFERFTKPVDVGGHELAHAVVEHTAGLVYAGEPGALNESVADVFAACLKQRLLGQRAEEADWLIGAGLFRPGVRARGLRDMAAPGTAYDDPALGRDPQPAHYDDLVVTEDDNGGVHLNSGIPNRAFHLAATAIGGTSWEGAGRVWYAALTGDRVGPRTDFAGFAAATVAVAGEHAAAVADAWARVGVRVAAPGEATPPPSGAPPPSGVPRRPGAPAGPVGTVRVRRTGGFAGMVATGEVDLGADDDRGREVAGLVAEIDLPALAGAATQPYPDAFVYDFDVCGTHARLPEQALTPPLRRLADLLIDPGR